MDRRDFVKVVGAASLAVIPGRAAATGFSEQLQHIANATPNLSDPALAQRIEAATETIGAVTGRLQNIGDAVPNLLDPEKPPVLAALDAFDLEAQDTLRASAEIRARVEDIAGATPNLSDPAIANRIGAATETIEAVNARLQNIAEAVPNLLDPEKAPALAALDAFDLEAQDTLQTSAQIRVLIKG
jgi:hypothetical protein